MREMEEGGNVDNLTLSVFLKVSRLFKKIYIWKCHHKPFFMGFLNGIFKWDVSYWNIDYFSWKVGRLWPKTTPFLIK